MEALIIKLVLLCVCFVFFFLALYFMLKYFDIREKYDNLKKEKVPKLTDSEAVQRLLYDMSSGEGLISVNYVDPSNIYYHRR